MTDGLKSHGIPAGIDPEEWTVGIDGAVERGLTLTPPDLTAIDSRRATEDFECVEGWRAEDLRWGGALASHVVERASPEADATHALVAAADGDYACGFALDRLDGAMLAVELDGEPIPVEHGGPVRLVPLGPDDDCWESVKWVDRIQVLDHPPDAADTAERIARSRIE